MMGRHAFPLARSPVASAITFFGIFVGMAACGTGGGGSVAAGGLRDDITRRQIEILPEGTAFDIVERLRPRWLEARSPGTPWNPTPTYAMVFVDGLSRGALYALDQISVNQIDRIEFLNARDATTRYGTGYPGGIIHVVTRNRGQSSVQPG